MMEQNDARKANDLIGELRQHSSAYGNGLQRMAYYFMEALVARLSGTGGQLYAAVCSNGPPPVMLLKAYRLYVDNLPYTKINHLFSNTTILDAFEGASCVHVIDYGIGNGVQWPCLIQDLATRPGGPPHLRITGIFFLTFHIFTKLFPHILVCLECITAINFEGVNMLCAYSSMAG
jgi:hypothetical protein